MANDLDFREIDSLREANERREQRLQKIRQEQSARRTKMLGRAIAAITALTVLVVLSLAVLGPVRLSPLSDTWRLIGRAGDGFPVGFSYSHTRQAAMVGGSVALLGPTQFDIINNRGYRSVTLAQPYPLPSLRAAGNRVVMFDRGSGNLTLFGRTRELYRLEFDHGIFVVDINARGDLAVATRSDRATSEIIVYDTNQTRQLHWLCEREHPSALRLSNNGRSLGMCLIGVEQANVYSRFVDFSLNADTPRTDLRIDGTWLYDTATITGGWLAVGDQAIYIIRHGAATAQTISYEGRGLIDFHLQNNHYSAILLEDWDGRVLLRIYDQQGSLAQEQSFTQRPTGVTAQGRAVYLHFDDVILRWQRGVFRQSQPLPPGTQQVLVRGRDAYLIGVRQVEHMRVRWSAMENGFG